MDIHELRELMLDIECMTVLRHVMDKPAMAALYRLVCDCANDGTSENELVYAYCEVYNAWLAAASQGRGGFARAALESVKEKARRNNAPEGADELALAKAKILYTYKD